MEFPLFRKSEKAVISKPTPPEEYRQRLNGIRSPAEASSIDSAVSEFQAPVAAKRRTSGYALGFALALGITLGYAGREQIGAGIDYAKEFTGKTKTFVAGYISERKAEQQNIADVVGSDSDKSSPNAANVDNAFDMYKNLSDEQKKTLIKKIIGN
jgi:hypothetical protein